MILVVNYRFFVSHHWVLTFLTLPHSFQQVHRVWEVPLPPRLWPPHPGCTWRVWAPPIIRQLHTSVPDGQPLTNSLAAPHWWVLSRCPESSQRRELRTVSNNVLWLRFNLRNGGSYHVAVIGTIHQQTFKYTFYVMILLNDLQHFQQATSSWLYHIQDLSSSPAGLST